MLLAKPINYSCPKNKTKAKFYSYLFKEHIMEVHEALDVQPRALLGSALDGGEVVSFTTRPLYPRGSASAVHIWKRNALKDSESE